MVMNKGKMYIQKYLQSNKIKENKISKFRAKGIYINIYKQKNKNKTK